MEDTPVFDIPAVSYPTLGGYYITVMASNNIPLPPKVFTYDIYVQLPPFPDNFNYSADSPAMIPYGGSASVNFYYYYSGPVLEWPSNASVFLDFGDYSNHTEVLDNTIIPYRIFSFFVCFFKTLFL